MKILNENNNRLAIYVFFDERGVVDDYIPYFLRDLKKNIKDLIVVCNGRISPEGYKCFEEFTDTILVRDNVGLDTWAYKTGLDHVGWEKLEQYDEVLMVNDTILGPVYPFAEMFATMDRRDLDFWGMTKHYRLSTNAFENEYGYTPEHLQTFFLACRASMVKSEIFQEYWDNLPKIKSYKDAVGKHETYFTKYFYDNGFQYDAYVQTDDLEKYNPNPIFAESYRIMVDRKCPVFKKKLFFMDYEHIIGSTNGDMVSALYEYIDKHTNYDVNLILQTLLRAKNEADVAKCLHMNYIMPSQISSKEEIKKQLQIHKAAVILYVHDENDIKRLYQYALSIPREMDIYILCSKLELQDKVKIRFEADNCHTIIYVETDKRGREVSGFLVGMREYVNRYEFICFAQNVEIANDKYISIEDGHERRNLENVLGSEDYVYNIIQKFIENPKLGMASPALPNHAYYLWNMGNEWGGICEYERTVELAKELGIEVPLSFEGDMMSPYGHCFWCRVEALSVLFNYDWEYGHFPIEENGKRSEFLRAVENLYAPAAQQMGYYAARIFTDESASVEYTNLHHYLRKQRLVTDYGNVLTSSLFYAEEEFQQEKSLVIITKKEKGSLKLQYRVEEIEDKICQLRFDPCEEMGAVLQGVSITLNYEDGTSYEVKKETIHHNGYEIEDGYMFLHNDPQLFFAVPYSDKKIIEVNVKCNQVDTLQELSMETMRLYMGKVTEAWKIIEELGSEQAALQAEVQGLRETIDNMEHSISWKISKPIRMINRFLKIK